MKLCQFQTNGRRHAGLVDAAGAIRDLSAIRAAIGPGDLSPAGIEALRAVDPQTLPLADPAARLTVPYDGMSKFVCIGLNYRDHAQEAGLAIPSEPIIFLKAPSALSGPYDDIVAPDGSTQLDWEVELGVVIGTRASYVREAEALDHVAGYCVVNDVSERAFQFQSQQWDKGKGCDSFGPVGPWLVTADEVPDPQGLDMWLDVNGAAAQRGRTSTMIFSVRELVSYCSRFMTLLPGDIIATGTPPGVGMGMKPAPRFLAPGDVVTLGIGGLGEQRQRVVLRRA